MKRKRFLFYFIMIVSFLFMTKFQVLAKENLVMEYQNNPYYLRKWSDHEDSGKMTFFNLNGDVAYCVEPGIHVSDNQYVETSLLEFPHTNNELKMIQLISYYGYEYPHHQTDRYRLATQVLIWETLEDLKTEIWTERNGKGDVIDITDEKNAILNLVKNIM